MILLLFVIGWSSSPRACGPCAAWCSGWALQLAGRRRSWLRRGVIPQAVVPAAAVVGIILALSSTAFRAADPRRARRAVDPPRA